MLKNLKNKNKLKILRICIDNTYIKEIEYI